MTAVNIALNPPESSVGQSIGHILLSAEFLNQLEADSYQFRHPRSPSGRLKDIPGIVSIKGNAERVNMKRLKWKLPSEGNSSWKRV